MRFTIYELPADGGAAVREWSAAVSQTSRSTFASSKFLQAIHALRLALRAQLRSENDLKTL